MVESIPMSSFIVVIFMVFSISSIVHTLMMRGVFILTRSKIDVSLVAGVSAVFIISTSLIVVLLVVLFS